MDVEGVLRQDYVLVDDTRAVEFNRVADGKLPGFPFSSPFKFISKD